MRITLLLLCLCIILSCNPNEDTADGYGNFEATTITVSSQVPGKIIWLEVEEGRTIEEGTQVALIDTTGLNLQKAQIQAGINTLPKKLRNTLADIEVLNENKGNLLREKERIQRLIKKEAATQRQLDEINDKVDLVDKQIQAIRSNTSTANSAILAEKEPLIAQIAVINHKIESSLISNPSKGTVLSKLAEPSEIVGMGTPIYRLGQLDKMTLRFYVSAKQLDQIKIGESVRVYADKGSDEMYEMEGKISWISKEAEFTPKTIQTREERVNLVYAIKAEVDNLEGILKIGMPGEVRFNEKNEQ